MRLIKRRLGIVLACTAACVAGVSMASALSQTGQGADERPDPGRPETAQVGARSPDPEGGPDWVVRSHKTEGDRLCVEIGRGDGNDFGRAVGRGAIAHRAPDGNGVCRPSAGTDEHVAIAQFAQSGEQGPRTVVFGRALTADAKVRIIHESDEMIVPVNEDGTFLLPLSGRIRPTDIPVEITRDNGDVRRLDWR